MATLSAQFRKKYLTRNLSPKLAPLTSTNPFFDLGKTHTFSDWWAASLLDQIPEGFDPNRDHGALPDLSDWLSRDKKRAVDLEALQKLWKQSQSPIKKFATKNLSRKPVFDLGSGDARTSPCVRIFAEFLKAPFYVGVDKKHARESDSKGRQIFVKSDILKFLAQLELTKPAIYFFAGVDPRGASARSYLLAIQRELKRLSCRGTVIILGVGSTGFGLTEKDYKIVSPDGLHSIYLKK